MDRGKQKKYDRREMATASCRLRREDYENLRDAARLEGVTVHAFYQTIAIAFLRAHGCALSAKAVEVSKTIAENKTLRETYNAVLGHSARPHDDVDFGKHEDDYEEPYLL